MKRQSIVFGRWLISMRALLAIALAGPLLARAGVHYQTLRSFGRSDLTGENPATALIQGSDGALYGTTSAGGPLFYGAIGEPYTVGTLFRMNPDGTGYQVLHLFLGGATDGAGPSPLIEAKDGWLYGTTARGGTNDAGSIYTVRKDGTGYHVLRFLNCVPGDGCDPAAGPLEGADGKLYGSTLYGGTNNMGTVFRLNKDGSGYEILAQIGTGSTLVQALDGTLYGMTPYGVIIKLSPNGTGPVLFPPRFSNPWCEPNRVLVGDAGFLIAVVCQSPLDGGGIIARLRTDGTGYEVLRNFKVDSPEGSPPVAGLISGPGQALYGTTSFGGSNSVGIVFKLSQDDTGFAILHHFHNDGLDGVQPLAPLLLAADGRLYGTTVLGGRFNGGTAFRINSDGSGYEVLRSFNNNTGDDGQAPESPVVFARDGLLYGTTTSGGTNNAGTLFKLRPDGGGCVILHHFATNGVDGLNPSGSLVEDGHGMIYGMTQTGGALGSYGTLFRWQESNEVYQVLYTFNGSNRSPDSLLLGSDGALYGTAPAGGRTLHLGDIFKLNPDGGGLESVHAFGTSDGTPSSLIEGSDGVLYGTTDYSGTEQPIESVFRVNKDGSAFRVLQTFAFDVGQVGVPVGLMQSRDGALFGWTTANSMGGDFGTIFKLNPDGSGFTVLSNAATVAGITEGNDGILYGLQTGGCGFRSPCGDGNVFSLNRDLSGLSPLHSFQFGEGTRPGAKLVLGPDGLFYGTASAGADLGFGAVFRLWPIETPDLLGVRKLAAGVEIVFDGTPGQTYELQSSVDLVKWSHLATRPMPSAGLATNLDNAALRPAVYYRAAWRGQ